MWLIFEQPSVFMLSVERNREAIRSESKHPYPAITVRRGMPSIRECSGRNNSTWELHQFSVVLNGLHGFGIHAVKSVDAPFLLDAESPARVTP